MFARPYPTEHCPMKLLSLPTSTACNVGQTAALLGAMASTAIAQTAPPAEPVPVIAIVKVAKPWYAPKVLVVSKMRDTIPQYARLSGLSFKAFSFEQSTGAYGGIYFWQNAGSAQSWFSPAWHARVKQERGSDANVRFLEAPVSIDNTPSGTPAHTDSSAVATVVQIGVPAGVSRERLVAEFLAAVPTYQKVPGLLRKHFTLSAPDAATGTFGGVYLWKDAASAQAWFNEAWHQRVKKTYGQDAVMEWFDTPILLPTQDAANAPLPSTFRIATP